MTWSVRYNNVAPSLRIGYFALVYYSAYGYAGCLPSAPYLTLP